MAGVVDWVTSCAQYWLRGAVTAEPTREESRRSAQAGTPWTRRQKDVKGQAQAGLGVLVGRLGEGGSQRGQLLEGGDCGGRARRRRSGRALHYRARGGGSRSGRAAGGTGREKGTDADGAGTGEQGMARDGRRLYVLNDRRTVGWALLMAELWAPCGTDPGLGSPARERTYLRVTVAPAPANCPLASSGREKSGRAPP